jgi:hypothetical protein
MVPLMHIMKICHELSLFLQVERLESDAAEGRPRRARALTHSREFGGSPGPGFARDTRSIVNDICL